MNIQLFSTLSSKHETFIPGDKNRITMYVCGPTVYNHIHIGNARPIVVFDTLFRLLKLRYQNVIYARNITDIDDKIINVATQSGCGITEVTAQYTRSFHDNIAKLNVLEPTVEPKATEHIPQMTDIIARLIKSKHAYEAEGHVLFAVSSMPNYGCLSKRDRDGMLAGARVDIAPYKKDPMDFVLWKPSTQQHPGWDSPWGRGRPGWHLECSAMAYTHLGEVIDIHGGGQDLIFPHHENEIAQSCCAFGHKQFARYWVHNGYIQVDGEKMSKSLGNFTMLADILSHFHGEVIRLSLLSTQYRKPLDWSLEGLRRSKSILDKWYRHLSDDNSNNDTSPPADTVLNALYNDLNTPQAIAEMHALVHQPDILRASGNLLGLLRESPNDWFKWTPNTDDSLNSEQIESLISKREQARLNKNFDLADSIRDQLNQVGVVLEDRNGKTYWHRKSS